MDSDVDSSAVGGSSGLFDFSGLGDKSAGDVWTVCNLCVWSCTLTHNE